VLEKWIGVNERVGRAGGRGIEERRGVISVMVLEEIDKVFEPIPKRLSTSAQTDAYAVTIRI